MTLKTLDFTQSIVEAEKFLLSLEQKDLPVRHYFANGMYARELFIPKGTVLTGAIHKTEHLCVMYGDIEIRSEFNNGRFTGYHMFVSQPGEKRIGYAHEDTYFTTMHPASTTDTDELEKLLTCRSYEEYGQYLIDDTNKDYQQFLLEYNFTEEQIQPLIQNTEDRIDIQLNRLELQPSLIHGTGLFATEFIENNSVIGFARINNKRTQLGRYINHSPYYNAIFKNENNDLVVYAITNINIGDEILIDYRQASTVNGYNQIQEITE